ncbi:CoA pyrophosphatase [Hwanghaeella grinnelliae]|uniref:CoA pyrophosphatase n=1 Tax=Hwanghaeella grinnelliae TaxID=2500179 RepID=A0A437QMW7_9PROT|nr:CoA pyrophosphatase [Hwanghaeella grinnelliae]RVU35884.1 CoA pyrophosphatase [Hwanghaeella grinnelliae]
MKTGVGITDEGAWREAIRQRVLAASEGGVIASRGDNDLNPGMKPLRKTLTPAAVLVALVDRPDGFTVLLTQRTDHLRDHAGQISFPGGKIEEHDEDPVATALREAEEEVGLAPHKVEVVGSLDRYVTRTGFAVTPVVGFVDPPFTLKLDPFEVAEVFEVPLRHFLTPGNRQQHSYELEGVTRRFYAMPYNDYYIWGATAGMLVNLADILMAERVSS